MLIWEKLKCEMMEKSFLSVPPPYVLRAKVLGGWFVTVNVSGDAGGPFFYPDPEHLWDGSSLP